MHTYNPHIGRSISPPLADLWGTRGQFPDFFPFFKFKFIFLKINFFNTTTSNAHNSANIGDRDLLLVSFCREFYLVRPPGLNSKPTTWYLFIQTHTPTFCAKATYVKITPSTSFRRCLFLILSKNNLCTSHRLFWIKCTIQY